MNKTFRPDFATEVVSPHVTRILTPFGDCVYVVCGSERALLLDTGYGIGDLRSAVCDIAGEILLTVLLSHGHVDHVGGAAQFDDVRMSVADEVVAAEHGAVDFRLSFLGKILPSQLSESGLERDDFLSPMPLPYVPVADGEVFDLGGVSVVTYTVPGHTPGMLVPVVREDRVAVFGDACGENTLLCFPESLPTATYLESLYRLREHEEEWDIVVRNHGTHASPKSLLERNIMLAERIVAGTDDALPVTTPDGPALMASADHSPDTHGNIIYKANDPRSV